MRAANTITDHGPKSHDFFQYHNVQYVYYIRSSAMQKRRDDRCTYVHTKSSRAETHFPLACKTAMAAAASEQQLASEQMINVSSASLPPSLEVEQKQFDCE